MNSQQEARAIQKSENSKVLEEIMAESCLSILWKLETTDPRISISYPKQDNDEAIHIYRYQGIPCANCFQSRNEVFKAAKEKTCITYRRMKIKGECNFHKLCKLKDDGTS